ncbi:hypothetical protein V1L52_02300 [Treponema sp. HNW]|uniref:hypothetical protein n=1 Tax=Treponema sp. HNW TaxID=3116654 RepID=UPI003D0A2AE3
MKNIKTAVFFSLCVLLLYTACPHNERPGPGINPGSQDSAPYVEGGISLVVSRDKKTIELTVKASGSSNIVLEGAEPSSVTNNFSGPVTVKDRVLILKPSAGEQPIEFSCTDQKIMRINASGCKTLTSLICNGNLLDTLKVHTEAKLTHVTCSENRLTNFDARFCKELVSLECGNNKLTSLDLSGLNYLTKADCWQNNLTELKLTGCTALKQIECYNNDLKENAFIALLNALPDRTSAGTEGKAVLYKEGETGNVTDFTTPEALTNAVAAATNNNWKLYKKTDTEPGEEI